MKHFHGVIYNNRGGKSVNSGTRDSGMRLEAMSKDGAIILELHDVRGVGHVSITFAQNPLTHQGATPDRVLYRGPISGEPIPPQEG